MSVCIATGWHSNGISPNEGVSESCYDFSWLSEWWTVNKIQENCNAASLYVSQCQIYPNRKNVNRFANVSYAVLKNDTYHARHDSWSAMLSGAIYAYNNDLHLVYIEQDCFVHGLEKAIGIALAEDEPIFYGYGENASAQQGWAEYSFIFVKRDFLPSFISLIINIEADRVTNPVPEIVFHDLFKDYFRPWPFGYGRLPVKNWQGEIFYKQQLSENDINKFKTESLDELF